MDEADEQTLATSSDRIEDNALAPDMAHTKDPHHELAHDALTLGEAVVSEELVDQGVTAEQVSDETAATHEANEATASPESAAPHITFGRAEAVTRQPSDAFVDKALELGGLRVKAHLDSVEPTERDLEVAAQPTRIADYYRHVSEMIARNLRVATDPSQPALRTEAVQAKEAYLVHLKQEIPKASQEISWYHHITNQGRQTSRWPRDATEYRGFDLRGTDILNQDLNVPGVRLNLRVQRQGGANFLVAYSTPRLFERLRGTGKPTEKRIYLNPDIEATPGIFEEILNTADEAGVPLQMKMLLRSGELYKGMDRLRGDGIVVTAVDEQADQALELVLGVTSKHEDAFKGRRTARIAQPIADGIALGDESPDPTNYSLTGHRDMIIQQASQEVEKSGKKGAEARQAFRAALDRIAKENGVNPKNLAFNL